MSKLSLQILLFLLAVLYGAHGAVCPNGFKLINGNKCLRVFTNNLKHLEAETDCSYLGGTLVTIKNAVDNRAITNLAASVGANTVWIGVFCFATGNTTTCYSDDNSGVLNFKSFAAGNPAVQGNGGCVYMQVSGKNAGQWMSAPCEVIGMPFICEVPLTNPDSSCKRNYNGYCYLPSHELQISSPNATYSQAEAICQSNNADLVSIHSKPEVDYIRAIYRNAGAQSIYLGAQAFLPDTFDWVDGSNWDFDNTDPLATIKGDCLAMDLSSKPNNGMWSETNCQNINYFLCKRRIGGAVMASTVMPSLNVISSLEEEEENVEKKRVNPRFNLKKHSELLDYSNCNATILMSPGTITSFGYPNTQPPVAYCTWNLAALGPYRIGIYFTDFSTYANVRIYDEFGNLISQPNGNQRPFSVLGATNVVQITHDSSYDAYYNYHGFSATILPY
ncbi:Protein CBG07164 [Caenorhabditis briggsae]|uniref:Protein CBG07164 n=1 Tax=Caenorhabditis briggsae TaxID=6238 RepID=A8X3K4_CAEBR|nr:Protein CBG07164 [Caenorhabditis briggsae]CAP27214.1 Protein CBG07164 [Caenorhabditis briggsae]